MPAFRRPRSHWESAVRRRGGSRPPMSAAPGGRQTCPHPNPDQRRSYREFRCWSSHLTGTPPVEHTPITLGRPTRTAIANGHRDRGSGRRRGSSVEIAGHGVRRAHAFLNDPDDLDDSRRIAHSSSHLVPGRHHGRGLGQSIVDAHVSTPAGRGGVRPRLRQPDRPQPPIDTGRLHGVHHAPAARRSSARSVRGCRTCRRAPRS